MTRAAIYARYSTDLQSDASIEDQIRLCELRAKGDGSRVVQTYPDHAISGASMMRPGIQMLMQDAAAGKFDVIYAEAMDRLSRDQEDIAAIFKRLSFAGVRIITLSEGEISQLHVGLKGTMNALFLKDLADKTRRGLRGRVEQGKSGGGKCFGYDVVMNGEERGNRAINEAQASVVRRIFEDYAAGKSPKAIALALNKEKVPGPTGKAWGQSTINGNRERGTGILNNELYIGRLVWNRLRYLKDPETGKRISRPNPEEDWIIHDVPELRIIEQDLWERVKARQGNLRTLAPTLHRTNRPRYLLSNLLKCGECGGGYSMISQTSLGCSTARNKGTCSNRRTIKREELEQRVLGSLDTHLLDEDLSAVFCVAYAEHMNKLARERNAKRDGYLRELEKIEKERKKIVQSILDGVPGSMLKDDANRLVERKEEIEGLLNTTEEAPVLLHPRMGERYQEEVRQLVAALNDPSRRAEASEIIRSLISCVILTPSRERDDLDVDLVGDLAGILSMAVASGKTTKAGGLPELNPDKQITNSSEIDAQRSLTAAQMALVAGKRCQRDLRWDRSLQMALVAGVGFEPTTFRL